MEIFNLLDDQVNATCSLSDDYSCCYCFRLNRSSFYHIEASLDSGSAAQNCDDSINKKREDTSQIDIPSCIHFMIDLFTQWLQNPVSFLPSFFTHSHSMIKGPYCGQLFLMVTCRSYLFLLLIFFKCSITHNTEACSNCNFVELFTCSSWLILILFHSDFWKFFTFLDSLGLGEYFFFLSSGFFFLY